MLYSSGKVTQKKLQGCILLKIKYDESSMVVQELVLSPDSNKVLFMWSLHVLLTCAWAVSTETSVGLG